MNLASCGYICCRYCGYYIIVRNCWTSTRLFFVHRITTRKKHEDVMETLCWTGCSKVQGVRQDHALTCWYLLLVINMVKFTETRYCVHINTLWNLLILFSRFYMRISNSYICWTDELLIRHARDGRTSRLV